MIVSAFHPGSGIGDQLFCYLAARITAQRLGVPYGMLGTFKGNHFMKLDYGDPVPHTWTTEYPAGKIVVYDMPVYEGKDWYDPEFNFIKNDTFVDGCRLQDERYFESHWGQIREWLDTEPVALPDKVCVINFRGGEFKAIPELFLPEEYWDESIRRMKELGFTDFHVHTDDVETAMPRALSSPTQPSESSLVY